MFQYADVLESKSLLGKKLYKDYEKDKMTC